VQATALITGGGGGLGAAVVSDFLAHGWRVVAPHRGPEVPEGLQAHGQAGDRLVAVRGDVFEPDEVSATVREACASEDQPLAAIVNLIGGFAAPGRVHETPVDAFENMLRLNLRATYLVCSAAIPALLEHGSGAIVCVGTRATQRPFSGAAGYISSKSALLGLVDALAAEYTGDGVRTNAVLPSVIDTAANRSSQPSADHSRWVKPDAIASVIRFLCSPESAPISGAHVPVYGRA